MDSWKKYMQENEHNLSIEEVDENIWQNVKNAAIPSKMTFFNKMRNALEELLKRFQVRKEVSTYKGRNSKYSLAYASMFFVFIIGSFAFKVKSRSKYGDMVTFEQAKETYVLKNETHTQSLFNLFSRFNDPSDSSSFLFITFIKENNEETKKIVDQLKEISGVSDLVITPVVFEFKESLFSSLLNKVFEIQINEAKPDDTQIENKIKEILQGKGLGSVDVQLDDSQDVLFSSEKVHQQPSFSGPLDSMAIANDITDQSDVPGKKDTTEPNAFPKNMRMDMSNLNSPGWKKDLELMSDLTNALEKVGLVDNKKPYKLEIKNGELYIDGKKQPKEVNDKFKRYFKNDDYTISNDGDESRAKSNYDIPKDKPKTGPQPGTNGPKFDPIEWQKELKLMYALINGLHDEGLIDKRKPYEIQIKEGELYIDRKKQPKEVSDKFRKYFYSDNYGFIND